MPLPVPEVAQVDLAYHDVHRGHGLCYQLQRSGVVERTARDIDIFEAKPSRRPAAAPSSQADPAPARPPHR